MNQKLNVLEYLEESARHHPNHCAIIDESGAYSYKELLESSKRAGVALARFGATGRAVVIVSEKSFSTLIAMLGTLYAGGFYVPVDPNAPVKRIRNICSALNNPLVIDGRKSNADFLTRNRQEDLCLGAKTVVHLDSLFVSCTLNDTLSPNQIKENDELLANIRLSSIDVDPVYILFTSGTTGKPKGVVVHHKAVLSFIDSFVATFDIRGDDRIANQAPFDFDVSVKDIYGALAVGATLILIPRTLFSKPFELAKYLEIKNVTVMIWAVAALCLMTTLHAFYGHDLSSVRMVLFSGEIMPKRHLDRWMKVLHEAKFVNLYGPSEIICNCMYHVVDRNRTYPYGIPLGTAFANREVFLLKDDGNLATEVGDVGEIYVRGSSLASGYVGMLNSQKNVSESFGFVQNPRNNLYTDPVYRTGDYAEILEGGEILYRGRRDNQIKHQGHRIELEEIDRTVERQDGVTRCRSVYDHKRNRLLAFYEGNVDEVLLAQKLRNRLPRFMVPSKVMMVTGMPLTKNGKVDRVQLMEESYIHG